MRGATFGVLFAALCASVAACEEKPTSISVEMTTTLSCAELKGVVVAVSTAGVPDERTLDTPRCTDGSPESRVGTVVIVPGGANDAKITVRVVAGVSRPAAECSSTNGFEGCIVARRTLRFAPNREIDVPIVLRKECAGVGCDDQSTCVKGQCRPALIEDPFACTGSACDEGTLGPAKPSVGPPPGDDGGPKQDGDVVERDGGTDAPFEAGPAADGGPQCGASEKICGARCVSSADPAYGCLATGCSACPGLVEGDYACAADKCVLIGCKPGFKRCGDGCLPSDAAHGCGAASCAACDSTNGTASCKAGTPTTCEIACATGFKLCGGKCVSVSDPTYGCTVSGCSATACPTSAGTLACSGNTCVIGSCPAGTKNCNQKCVPTDVQNGCESTTRCTACGTSEQCSGTPSVCTCMPQSPQTTCQGKSCGPATNNCGQVIQCPNHCTGYDTCGGGGAGPNRCGCTSTGACSGKNCDYDYDNCGRAQYCGSCTWPEFCGAASSNVCGFDPYGNCGPNWPTMGTFTCNAGVQYQTICGCNPQGYYDSSLWSYDGSSCYTHMTGAGC